MKPLLVFLVVANVLLFGWFRGWMAPLGGDGRDPQRIQREVQPNELRVTSASRLPGGAAATPNGGATAAARGGAGSAEPAGSAAGAATGGAECVAFGPLTELEAVRAQSALDAAAADLAITLVREDEITSWWVYLPAVPGELARRVADLRSRGVNDIYVMPDGAWRGAISLGLFRQEELAVALARAITERGVRGVRVAPRGPGPGRLVLQVRPVGAAVAAELDRLRAQHPEASSRPCSGS